MRKIVPKMENFPERIFPKRFFQSAGSREWERELV
jgi:hypothetical protein